MTRAVDRKPRYRGATLLSDALTEALAASSGVTSNPYLQFVRDSVEFVESSGDSTVQPYLDELRQLVGKPHFALNSQTSNEFIQKLGEVHFYCRSKESGVQLERVPETGNKKVPDFFDPQSKAYFEVKTLSVVDGQFGIDETLQAGLSAQIQIEKQVASRKPVAIAESVIQLYGKMGSSKGHLMATIDILIEKARQNITTGQFKNPRTYLVLDLSMLPLFGRFPDVLRPACIDRFMFPKPMSGQLWMVAFSRPGMLIHSIPEFEGKPAIEGLTTKEGLLHEFGEIAGLLISVHPLESQSAIGGLFRSDATPLNRDCRSIVKIVGHFWNDELDSNGWRLNSGLTKRKPRSAKSL